MSNLLDGVYKVFVLILLLGIVCLDMRHWPVWPKDWVFSFSEGIEQYHIKKFNDPLSANLPVPNGWQSGMYFCEQLHLPFLIYFLFAKNGIAKELGAIIVGTQISVVVSQCLWEIWAFDEAIVTRDQKLTLNWLYIPFLVVPVIMVVDMVYRVNKRVEAAEKVKTK